VPVIAIPLALGRAAACAMEATNGPAVQSLTWTPTVKNPRLKKVFPRTETDPPLDSKIFKNRNAHLHRLVRELTPGNGSIERPG
jgi:hypothetical protein